MRLPKFPHLKENNVRTGFLEDGQYLKLVEGADLWFRALVECGRTYGWRVSELLLKLRVGQVDLLDRIIRLEVGTTKNGEGREVSMTTSVHALLSACITGKKPGDWLFTRPNGKQVKSFRGEWYMQCTAAGLGQLYCAGCAEPQGTTAHCEKCGHKGTHFRGLKFHDLRRTAARNLRKSGVAEKTIMKIAGWKTRSVFDRYNIVDQSDVVDAMERLEAREARLTEMAQKLKTQPEFGHSLGTMDPKTAPQPATHPVKESVN
jgi:integrase